MDAVYTRESLDGLDVAHTSPPPGQFPYTRGLRPDGYHGKLWTMRQFAGFGTPRTPTAVTAPCSRPAAPA